jgi:hypothetical protein
MKAENRFTKKKDTGCELADETVKTKHLAWILGK